jgi:hypothetical protein
MTDYKQCCIECGFHFFDEDECPNCDAIRIVEELEPTCEECGKLVDDWDDLEMPYCSVHYGDCYDLMVCPSCAENFTCPHANQYELEFEFDGLPF